ncbi:MAG: hypothetical protein Kow0077_15170 [Anaerolineae bacterium]
MIGNSNQDVYAMLQDPDPKVRTQAIRRLEAIADLESIPDLAAIYQSEDEKPAVRKAAREALGMFRAIQEALNAGQPVELPDPSTVKEAPITVELLRRIRNVLAIVLVFLLLIDGAVYLLKSGTLVPPPSEPEQIVAEMQINFDQFQVDVDNQRQAWHQFQAIQTLGCDRFPPPANTSTSTGWLERLPIDQATQPALFEAQFVFARAVAEFMLVANEWTVGCAGGTTSGADVNLARLDQIEGELVTIQAALDGARAALATPTPELLDLTPTQLEAIPVTLPPTPEPSPLPLSADRYAAYIRAMRDRIETAAVGRGVLVQLNQYWQDVRETGQTFGCGQVLTDETLQNYTGVTMQDAALDPRLNSIQTTINVGMTLARESLANFQQGCAAGNFSTVIDLGQPQAQQAMAAMDQATAMLTQLEQEIRRASQ